MSLKYNKFKFDCQEAFILNFNTGFHNSEKVLHLTKTADKENHPYFLLNKSQK